MKTTTREAQDLKQEVRTLSRGVAQRLVEKNGHRDAPVVRVFNRWEGGDDGLAKGMWASEGENTEEPTNDGWHPSNGTYASTQPTVFVHRILSATQFLGVVEGAFRPDADSYTSASGPYVGDDGFGTNVPPSFNGTDPKHPIINRMVAYPLAYDGTEAWVYVFGLHTNVQHNHQLIELADVDDDTPPNDGDVLIWDNTDKLWRSGPNGGGGGFPALDDLTDVTITSVFDRQFLRYDGATSQWINYDLGPIGYNPASGGPTDYTTTDEAENVLYFGNATLGTKMNVALANGSRFLVDGSTLEFLVRGTVAATTDKWARAKVVSGNIQFQDDGTEVLRWVCSATAGSRLFDFKIPVNILCGASGGFSLTSALGNTYTIANSGLAFEHRVLSGGQFEWRVNSALILLANDATLTTYNDVVLAGSGKKVGFFGSAGTVIASVSAPSSIATTQTAGGAYSANEQTMLANLKTDVTNLRATLAALRTSLNGYGLV